MRRSSVLLTAFVVMLALIGAGPAAADTHTDGTVCVVADWGGFDDPFAGQALDGAEKAAKKYQVAVDSFAPETEADLAPLLSDLVAGGSCDLLIGVGFRVAGEAEPLVAAYPDQLFSFIDFAYPETFENVASVQFRIDQPSFVAGYIAAGISETGAVGVYGGVPYPAVTMFMDGYALGVEYYNDRYGTAVEVLGWDVDTQTGMFTDDFQDPSAGYDATVGLFEDGADTVFAVAGPTGQGSLTAAAEWKADGHVVRVIEPDVDWYDLYGDEARVLLTSVLKNTDVAAFHQVEAFADGLWMHGHIWEDLASDGVGLAKFHKTNNQVPESLRDDLKPLMAEIMVGNVLTSPIAVALFSWEPLNGEAVILEETLEELTGLEVTVLVSADADTSLAYLCDHSHNAVGVLPTALVMPAYDLCGADPAYKAVRFGHDAYWTQFLAPRGSGYTGLEDFAGESWAYATEESTSSYIVPRGMLNLVGVDVAEESETGGHWQAVRAVYDGTVDFSTTYFSPPITPGDPWEEADPPDVPDEFVDDCELIGDPPEQQLWCDGYRVLDARQALARELGVADVVEKVEIVMISPGIPNDGLSFGGEMPTYIRDAVAGAFEEMADEGSPYFGAFVDSFGALYGWQGLSPADISEYAWIAEVFGAAGE